MQRGRESCPQNLLPQGARLSRSRWRPGASGQVRRGRGGPGARAGAAAGSARRAQSWRIFLQSQDPPVLCASVPPSPGLSSPLTRKLQVGPSGWGQVIPLSVPCDSAKACFMSWQPDHSRARFLFLAACVSLEPVHCLQSELRNISRRSACFQCFPYILLLCFCCRTTSDKIE